MLIEIIQNVLAVIIFHLFGMCISLIMFREMNRISEEYEFEGDVYIGEAYCCFGWIFIVIFTILWVRSKFKTS